MTVQTNQIMLTELTTSDAENILLLATDPEVTKYLDYLPEGNIEAVTKWVNQMVIYAAETPRSSWNYIIKNKKSNEFVGWIGIGEATDKLKGDLDFGYAILPKFQGRGIATEALKEIINMAWTNTSAQKIFGECQIENIASRKVMEKAGLVFEAEFTSNSINSVRYITSH